MGEFSLLYSKGNAGRNFSLSPFLRGRAGVFLRTSKEIENEKDDIGLSMLISDNPLSFRSTGSRQCG
jgi:hypothetical protein